ncbi:related to human and mouse neutral sphingomyelinase [Fusarium torulosum]|uniref:Related to human and mouse neutral sphingomyelinase n=1 Tax=Fusarium torulosum TaxID=33205 RepID=A0AAE8SIT1_9HYPO|nr:related to human and mouse neutral sphingomyelinase [Fusarium torulosum]
MVMASDDPEHVTKPTTIVVNHRHEPQSLPSEINLLTLNCWGLRYISTQRVARLDEIGHRIAHAIPTPHIVSLQECFTQEDYEAIRHHTRQILPYGKFYYSGAFGGGLAILSCWPIEESTMFKYPLNGRPTAFWRGDWYVGKGVACAKIRFGPRRKDIVEVFNTHTHSPYEPDPVSTYDCHRVAQSWEMSKLLRGAAERGHLVVGMGDFNMLPLSLFHRVITAHAPVRDVWRILHPDSSLGPAYHPSEQERHRPLPTADFNLLENGATSNSVYNTWRWNKNQQNRLKGGDICEVPPDTIDPRGQRLDYIFTSTGVDPDSPPTTPGWVVKSAHVAMTERHPDLLCSLSDHFAVQATLTRHTPSPAVNPPDPRSETLSAALQTGAYLAASSPASSIHSGDVAQTADPDTQLKRGRSRSSDFGPSTYDEIIGMIQKYHARELRQRHWRGVHFFVALFIWLACLVGVWFSPENYVAFILMLVSSLSLVAGVIDGLLSLLFFSWEIKGLKEFEWEIRNAKAVASGDRIALTESETYESSGRRSKST